MLGKINGNIRENRLFTITEVSLQFPQISQNLLRKVVTQNLCYHKFCARRLQKKKNM